MRVYYDTNAYMLFEHSINNLIGFENYYSARVLHAAGGDSIGNRQRIINNNYDTFILSI